MNDAKRKQAAAAVVWAGLFAAAARGQEVETIYDLPDVAPSAVENQGTNQGGVNLDLRVRYLTDYVFRGIDRSDPGGGFRSQDGTPFETPTSLGAEDAPNLQFDGRLEFDLGPLPHPFVGLFVNVYDDDPVSRFQEIRPHVGFEWNLRPLTFAGGYTNYIFPEREDLNTSEAWGSVTLDDSLLFGTNRPVLSPYVLAAYDVDLYDGLYLEVGLRHDMPIPDTPVTLSFVADAAYVLNHAAFTFANAQDTGFQHYDIGLIGRLSLNTLMNVPRRYGDFELEGYLFYTDGIENELLAETQLWGGVGIRFRY